MFPFALQFSLIQCQCLSCRGAHMTQIAIAFLDIHIQKLSVNFDLGVVHILRNQLRGGGGISKLLRYCNFDTIAMCKTDYGGGGGGVKMFQKLIT